MHVAKLMGFAPRPINDHSSLGISRRSSRSVRSLRWRPTAVVVISRWERKIERKTQKGAILQSSVGGEAFPWVARVAESATSCGAGYQVDNFFKPTGIANQSRRCK